MAIRFSKATDSGKDRPTAQIFQSPSPCSFHKVYLYYFELIHKRICLPKFHLLKWVTESHNSQFKLQTVFKKTNPCPFLSLSPSVLLLDRTNADQFCVSLFLKGSPLTFVRQVRARTRLLPQTLEARVVRLLMECCLV